MFKTRSMWALLAFASPPIAAQAPAWQVVAGENGQVVAGNLPAGTTRDITDAWVGDIGDSLFGFRVTSPSSITGYWARHNGQLSRYTQLNTAGALGPGRSGAEAAHVFLSIDSGWGGASPDGQRNFLARASDPAAALNASYGLWRWNGIRNIEVARGSTNAALGPGLGSNWVFENSGDFATARMLNGGAMLISAKVLGAGGSTSQVVVRHAAGLGNLPCMQSGAVDPALAPGLAAGETFLNFTNGIGRMSVSTVGQIHARLATSGSREGLWELCNGAPRAVALTGESGSRGPEVGAATAVFTGFGFNAPQSSSVGGLVFFANWRVPPDGSRLGLFRHDGFSNRGIAFTEASGYYGPNWLSSSWRTFNTDSLAVAGEYAAFIASVDTPEGGTPSGLWRVRSGERPELMALIGLSVVPYEPEPGRTWRSFSAVAVLSNGYVVVEANTDPGNTKDIWLLRAGLAPQRLLSTGQVINVPTSQGPATGSISSFDVFDGGANYSDGTDTWIAADGTLYVSANTANLGRLLITTKLAVPNPDIVFASGFEMGSAL
jgi:hypothetical protein